jgi:hypothetical protein
MTTLVKTFLQLSQDSRWVSLFGETAGIYTLYVLASNKTMWLLKEAFLSFIPMLTVSQSRKYFEQEMYKLFVPRCISLFPSSQDQLERDLGLLMTIDEGRNIDQLNITGVTGRSQRPDLTISTIDEAFPYLRKLKLTNLIIHGQLTNYVDTATVAVSCRRCIISPSARLGCGKVSIRFELMKPFDWAPVKNAKTIKLHVLPWIKQADHSFKEMLPDFLVRDLTIAGEVRMGEGYVIPNLRCLESLTFSPVRRQVLSIEGCDRLKTVVTGSGKYHVDGGNILIFNGCVSKLLRLSPE